jgi:hypothetical protein
MLSDRFASLRMAGLAAMFLCMADSARAQAPQPTPPKQADPARSAAGPGLSAPVTVPPERAPGAAPSTPAAPPPTVSVPGSPAPGPAESPGNTPAHAGSQDDDAGSSAGSPTAPGTGQAPQLGQPPGSDPGYPPPGPVYTAPTYGSYAPPSAYPAPPGYGGPVSRAPGPGSHEHEGFFLRLSLGGGAASIKYRDRLDGQSASDIKTRGLAGVFEVALGGRVVENFILHANLSISGADSDRDVDGIKDRSYDSLSTTFWMLGGGASYYFMPTNLYLTLVLGTGGFVEARDNGGLSTNEEQIESEPGFAGSLAIGKEWWVGGRGEWAIGASITAAFLAASVEIDDVESTAVGNCISLAFSATLN